MKWREKNHVEWYPSKNLRRPLNYMDSKKIQYYHSSGLLSKMMGLGKCIPGFKYSIIFGYLFTKFCLRVLEIPAIFEGPWSYPTSNKLNGGVYEEVLVGFVISKKNVGKPKCNLSFGFRNVGQQRCAVNIVHHCSSFVDRNLKFFWLTQLYLLVFNAFEIFL